MICVQVNGPYSPPNMRLGTRRDGLLWRDQHVKALLKASPVKWSWGSWRLKFRDFSLVSTCSNRGFFVHVSPLIEDFGVFFKVTLILFLLKRNCTSSFFIYVFIFVCLSHRSFSSSLVRDLIFTFPPFIAFKFLI